MSYFVPMMRIIEPVREDAHVDHDAGSPLVIAGHFDLLVRTIARAGTHECLATRAGLQSVFANALLGRPRRTCPRDTVYGTEHLLR